MKTILLNNYNYSIEQTSNCPASASFLPCFDYEQQHKGSSKYIKALYNKTCTIDDKFNTSRFLNE